MNSASLYPLLCLREPPRCYGAENRLVSAAGAGNTASYTFDAQGRRKTRTVNGTTTVSVTDAQNREVLEYNGSTGALLRWYAYGLTELN